MSDELNEEYWGGCADRYDEFTDYVVGRGLRQALAGRLGSVRDAGRVIECGCGTGFYTRHIAPNSSAILAVDIAAEMLEQAKCNLETFRHVSYLKADCKNLHLPDSDFDTALMANLLHTVSNPRIILDEIYRVLKKDGKLLIITYSDFALDFAEKAEIAVRFLAKFGVPPPHGLKNFTPRELRAFISNAGFQVDAVEEFGDHVKGIFLIARKLA
jgi:ubiquinone/menaquinone biosynthesis C-methylase UbiE